MMKSIDRVRRRFIDEPMTRIVAFGSSNTERAGHSEGRYSWVDWLDVGLRLHYGRMHSTINMGMSGQTSGECLARFERDVALVQPGVVIITLGGNDCNPTKAVPFEQFVANMTELVRRVQGLDDCVAVLQTYYAADVERLPPEPDCALYFHQYMQGVRDVAAATDTHLIDHLTRWDRLRLADVATYRTLMRDPMHLKPLGNMLIGLDVLRHFGATALDDIAPYIEDGVALQGRLDELEAAEDGRVRP